MAEPMEPIYGVQLLDDLHVYFPDILYNSGRFTTVQDLLQYVQSQSRTHLNLYDRGALQYQQQQERLIRGTPLSMPRRTPRLVTSAPRYAPPSVPSASSASSVPSVPSLRTATSETVNASDQDVPVTPPRPMRMSPMQSSVASPAAESVATATAPDTATAGAGVPSVPANTHLFTTTYSSPLRGFNTASGRTIHNNPPFRVPRVLQGTDLGMEFGAPLSATLLGFGVERFENDDLASLGIGANTQLLTSLLGLAFGDTGGTPAGFSGLPASFLEPVVIRPTIAQIDVASEVFTLSASIEGTCAVCQDTLEMGNQVRHLNVCNHSFHQECIDTWFERSVQCPVCRHDVRELASRATSTRDAVVEEAADLD
jgi:hypothetical protein